MASWNELLLEFQVVPPPERDRWFQDKFDEAFGLIRARRNDRNVILYGSGFLQKPQAPAPFISMQPEDLNGFMSVMHGLDCSKGLTLLLHTPGGSPTAAETVVAYLRSKFADWE